MGRRIKKAKIKFVSLVGKGANKMPVVYKADGTVEFATLTKIDGEAGELTSIVYAPEHRDSQGDIASAEVIKDMAYSWMRDGASVDVHHDGKALRKDQAHAAESFIVQKGDPRFDGLKDSDGKAVDPTGAWATVIKIDDPTLREAVKKGEIAGVSMAGVAEVEQEKADDAPHWLRKAMDSVAAFFGARRLETQGEDIEMNKQELVDVLKGFSETLVTSIKEVVKPAAQKTPEQIAKEAADKAAAEAAAAGETTATVEKAPEFKGDPTKLEDVQKHAKALAAFELRKDVKWGDPASVQAYLTKLEELNKAESGDANDNDGDEDVTELEKQIGAAAPAPSRQPVKKAAANDKIDPRFADLPVDVAKQMTEGVRMAELAGRRRKQSAA